MTKDEITTMAMDAGLMFRCPERLALYASEYVASIERFAALVAEKEREACAQACLDRHSLDTPWDCAVAIRARGQKEGV